MQIKKGTKLAITIEKVLFPNIGIAWIGDQEIRIKNTIPGQKVELIINKKKTGYFEARLLEILENSPLEDQPKCIHANECGGCSYQGILYEKQLEIKEK